MILAPLHPEKLISMAIAFTLVPDRIVVTAPPVVYAKVSEELKNSPLRKNHLS